MNLTYFSNLIKNNKLMEANNIVGTLKEAVNYLKDDKVTYEDENGNVLTLEKAMNDRVFVKPVDGKVKAREILANLGLDISQNSVRNLLTELASLIGESGTRSSSSTSSRRLTRDEKMDLVKEFQESGSKNKREFTNNKGIGYQSFLKWEKEFSQSN